MGFLSRKKNKKNNNKGEEEQRSSKCEIIPLYEQECSSYKVKQIFKVGKGKADKEMRQLLLTEEGVKLFDLLTGVSYNCHFQYHVLHNNTLSYRIASLLSNGEI